MKLPRAPATATSLTILAATIALPAPARAQTYDPSYPVCLQVYQGIADFYYECRYRTMAQCMPRRPQAAPPNAWSIHITAARRTGAASAKRSRQY